MVGPKKLKIFNFLLLNLQILRSVWVFSYEDFIRRVRLAASEWRGKITTSVNVAKVILYKQFSKFYQIFSVAQFSCNAWYIEEVQVTDENIWRKRLLWEFELSLWYYPIYFTFSRFHALLSHNYIVIYSTLQNAILRTMPIPPFSLWFFSPVSTTKPRWNK